MLKTDPQLKSNDGGISSIKTVFNLFKKNVSRRYIEQHLPLEEKGSRISEMKTFFEANGFNASLKLLDLNSIRQNPEQLTELIPFILPIKNKSNLLHYVVCGGLKYGKLKIYDPRRGKEYLLPLGEIVKTALYTENEWDLAETEDKITAICTQELSDYQINIKNVIAENGPANLYNKLTYFNYLKDHFGFKNPKSERDFLQDLLINQEISNVPNHFKILKFNKDKIINTAPLILVAKPKQENDIELPKEDSTNLYWILFKQLGQFKNLWYIYIFAALFSATTAQIAVFTNQILIDNILPSYNINTLLLFAIGLGIYSIFDLITTLYKSFVSAHLGNILDKFFLYSFDQKINKSSLSNLHSYKKGDLMERISDALKLKTFFLKFFTSILVDIFVSIYSLGILFFIDKTLTLVVIAVMILFFLWFKLVTPYLKQNERLRYMRKAEFLSKMMEKVEGIQIIKSFKIERFHSEKIFKSIEDYLKIQLKNGYIDLINKIVVALIVIFSSIFIMMQLTESAIVYQLITLGQIVTFIALSSKVFSSLKGILDDNLSLQENEVILKRYLDFDENIKKESHKGIADFEIENLKFKNLNYSYVPNENILKDINFEIKKNDKIKIEGQNGSGKSTLSKILTTLYLPKSGTILVNEKDRKFYNDGVMKDKILLISTEDILFNDTIYNNIALGKEISTFDIIEKAIQIDFYDFIASKEEGLEYLINENGKNLSTGQRKKILILRALFSKAEIIILDEVLSGMDSETRKKVEIIINNDDTKTYIIISHEPINHINFSKKYKIHNGELILL